MRFIEAIYLLFAVAHPVSEIVGRTSLRKFLNKAYYPTDREDFPVNKIVGIGGSLLVLVVLLIPLAIPFWDHNAPVVPWWYLALGLVLADVIQHAIHSFAKPQELAPRVHLITILGVLFFLLWIIFADLTWETITANSLWLLLGALLIFGNWFGNSWRVNHASTSSSAHPEGA
jgi:hypothetical protein